MKIFVNVLTDRIKKDTRLGVFLNGADDGARTRYLHLGKVALYQMSYARRTWCIIADIFAGVKGEFLYLGLGAF